MDIRIIPLAAGGVLLCLLCWIDYSRRVLKPKASAIYYLAFALFCFFNGIAYLSLVDLVGKYPVNFFIKPAINFTVKDLLTPITIAVANFAVGSATFTLGNKEINLYQELLRIFESIFKLDLIKIEKIRDRIAELKMEYEALLDKINDLHKSAKLANWDILKDKWNEINEQISSRQLIAAELRTICAELENARVSHERIIQIANEVRQKIDGLQQISIKQIKDYMSELIIKNIKNEAQIDSVIEPQCASQKKENSRADLVAISRCVVIPFIFGTLFGFFINSPDGYSPISNSWRGAITMSIIGVILSRMNKKVGFIPESIYVIVLGAMAGLAGYFSWYLMAGDFSFETAKFSVIGLQYGVAIALLTYLFKKISHKITSIKFIKYFAIGLSGGVLFCLLGAIAREMRGKPIDISSIWMISLPLGFLVMVAMAFSLDIFQEEMHYKGVMEGVVEIGK